MNDGLFNTSQEATPLRRDTVRKLRLDKDGHPFQEIVFSKTISLSPEGSIDQEQVLNERFYDCCHSAEFPIGGRCAEQNCFRVSCINCFTRCSKCNVGLCQCHVRRSDIGGQTVVFCSHCLGELKRHQFWKKFWNFILSPFVTFNK